VLRNPSLISSKIITATRNLADASGDVGYTGVGFKPRCIIAFGHVNNNALSIGVGDVNVSDSSVNENYLGQQVVNLYRLIELYNASGAGQDANLKSLDGDGFTLTWTKTGSPTGTANLIFLCLK
jgi:hypothetical protein